MQELANPVLDQGVIDVLKQLDPGETIVIVDFLATSTSGEIMTVPRQNMVDVLGAVFEVVPIA